MSTRTVSVRGRGIDRVVPDTALVRVSARSHAATVREAYAAVAKAGAVLVEVAQRHTEPRRIASSGLNLWPQIDNEGRPTGFQASHSHTIGCPDLEAAGAVVEDLTAALGDELVVEGVDLTVSDSSAAVVNARGAAFDDARQIAEQLAAKAGASLGAVLAVVEGGESTGPVSGYGGIMLARAERVSFAPGEQEVSVEVSVTWELL